MVLLLLKGFASFIYFFTHGNMSMFSQASEQIEFPVDGLQCQDTLSHSPPGEYSEAGIQNTSYLQCSSRTGIFCCCLKDCRFVVFCVSVLMYPTFLMSKTQNEANVCVMRSSIQLSCVYTKLSAQFFI